MKKEWLALLLLGTLLTAEETHVIHVQGKRIPFTFDRERQVIVIEGAALRQIPALSLPALIGSVANIQIVQRGLFQADPQFMGFNQEQLLLMVNGMPVNNAQTGHHNFALPLDLCQVERIEISRSAFSSLSGSAGAAGVINIITARQSAIHVSGGSAGTVRASLALQGRRWEIASGLTATDGFFPGLDGKQAFASAGSRLPIGQSTLELWGGWTSAAFGAANFYAPYNSFERLGRLLGTARWHWPIRPRTDVEARLSLQHADDRYTLVRENPGLYFNRHLTWQEGVEAEARHYGKSLSLRMGAALWADQINSRGIRQESEAPALGSHDRLWYSLLAEASREAGRVYGSVCGRATFGDARNLSGHLLAGIQMAKGLRLEGSIFRNFRIPTYTELYYVDPMHRSDPMLKPETSWGLSAGLSRPQAKAPGQLRIFYHEARDLIDWVGDAEQKIWLAQNIQRGSFYGIDLEQSFHLPRLEASFLYTWQQVRYISHPASQPLKYHYYFPDHSLSLSVGWNPRLLSLHSLLKVERQESTGQVRFFLNLRLAKDLGLIQVYVDADNILDMRLEKSPGVPEQPRSFHLGLYARLR